MKFKLRRYYLYYLARIAVALFGALPLAGFFCNGEIGPVGDKVFVHGFTSVLGLFEPIEKNK